MLRCICKQMHSTSPSLVRHVLCCPSIQLEDRSIAFRCIRCLNLYTSYSVLARHFAKCAGITEPASPVAGPSNNERGEVFMCNSCDRVFPTKIGLGLHMKSAHAVEHAASQPQSKKARWSRAEVDCLITAEAELQINDKCFHEIANTTVARKLSLILGDKGIQRTYEGILGQRKKAGYQDLVTTRVAQLSQSDTRPLSEQPALDFQNDANMAESSASTATRELTTHTNSSRCLSASSSWNCSCNAMLLDAIESHLRDMGESATKMELENTLINIDNFNIERFLDIQKGERSKRSETPPKLKERGYKSLKQQETGRIRDILDKEGPKRCLQHLRQPDKTGKCSRETIDLFKDMFESCSSLEDNERTQTILSKSNPHKVHSVITAVDVLAQLKRMKSQTSPGPDTVRIKNLKQAKPEDTACLLNIFLLYKDVPKVLKANRTTMIPKKSSPGPGDWRPITVSSVLDRLFAKVLESRLSAVVGLDARQKGFTRGFDGCGDNIMAYGSAIRYARLRGKPLVITSIDLAKAFDSVQYSSICRALKRLSVDEDTTELMSNLCHGQQTNINYDNGDETISLTKGVRQGWPLSPLLFLCVIDELLGELNQEQGFHVEDGLGVEHSLTGRAFADDLILYSDSVAGMQLSVTKVSDWCNRRNMGINPNKSTVLFLRRVPHKKKVVLDKSCVMINGSQIPTIEGTHERVLGIEINEKGKADHRLDKFMEDLNIIKTSALRPSQKLHMIRDCLIPMIKFRLVYGFATISTCTVVDRLVRKAVRDCMHLPKYTPLSTFNLKCADGGLGLPVLCDKVPVEQASLLFKMRQSGDDLTREFATSLARNKTRIYSRILENVQVASDLRSQKERLAEMRNKRLLNSIDADGWSTFRKAPRQFLDKTHGRNWKDHDMIDALKMRSNRLLTRTLMARTVGRGQSLDRSCRGCGYSHETQAHILSKCPSTQERRVARHDAVCGYLATCLRKTGCTTSSSGVESIRVEREYNIRVEAGESNSRPMAHTLRPDIMVSTSNSITLIEVSIVYESEGRSSTSLEAIRREKLTKYQHLRSVLQKRLNKQVNINTLIVGCRGGWIKSNNKCFAGTRFTLSEHDKNCIVERAVRGSLITYKTFMNANFKPLVQYKRKTANQPNSL